MKTAEDLLFELDYEICYNSDCSGSSIHWDTTVVINAMETYANEKLEKAAGKVKWNPLLKQSIRDLKGKV